MPLSKHFGGHGEEVMRNMRDQYGADEGERIFYATENKRKQGKKKKKIKHKNAPARGAFLRGAGLDDGY